jgi:hypothetical protein
VESILSKLRLGYTVMPPIFLNLVSIVSMRRMVLFLRVETGRSLVGTVLVVSECKPVVIAFRLSVAHPRHFNAQCEGLFAMLFERMPEVRQIKGIYMDLHTYVTYPLCLVLHSGMDDHNPYIIF